MDDLRILINVGINQGKAIGSINDQIKALEKHPSLQKIKLKIDIDKNFTNSINSFITAVGKMKKISDEQSRVVSETENVYKKLDGTIETVTQKVLKNGEVIEKTKRIHDENRRAMQDESLTAQKLAESIDKQNKADKDSITVLKNKANAVKGYRVVSSQGYTVTSKSLESDGQTLISSSETTNFKKEREDQLKEQQRLNKESEALDRAHFQAIRDNNKKIEDMEKLHYIALQQNQQKDIQFQQRIAAQQAKIADAQRRFGADSKVSSQLNSLNAKVSGIEQVKDPKEIEDYNAKLRNLDTELKNIIASSKNASSHMLGFGEALRTSFVKFPVWLISGTIFVNLTRFFTQGISYANQLNDSLTQISIVTGKNQQQVAALGQEYSNLSKELSVTTLAISQAATEFYRQGLSQSEVMERVKVSTEYAKISNLSFADSVDILTAAVNSMNVPIEKATDVFSYLGDATATGADEIGKAFQKVGGSAGALNLSFEKTASWIAVLSSRTREGAETIGQSVKSILARIQSLTENGFDEEDGTKINDVAKALASVGLSLTDSSGQFINFGTIMDQLGEKWKNLDSRQKAYLSTTIAGNFQQSRFLNLMEGYSDTIPLYQKSLEAAGTTQQKYNLYLEGTQAHLDRLKANMEGLWSNTFNSGGLQTGIDALSGLVAAISKVVETFGFLPTAVFATAAAFTVFSNSVRGFIFTSGNTMLNWLGLTQLGMTKLSLGVNRVAYSFGLSAGAARIFTLSIVGLTRAFLPLLAISAAAWGIQKLFSSIAESREATKKATEINYDNISSLRSQQDELKGLSAEYANLKAAQDSGTATNEQKERLLQLQTELVDKYGVSASGINAEGKAYTDSLVAIDARNKALTDEIKIENQRNLTKLRAKDSENTKDYQNELDATEDYLSKKKKLQDQLAEVQDEIANGTYKTKTRSSVRKDFGILDTNRATYDSSQIVELFNKQIALIDDKLSESTDTLQTALNDRITVLTNASDEYIGQMKNISDGERLYISNLIKSVAQNGEGIDQQIATVKSAVDQLSNSGFDELVTKFNAAKDAFYKTPTDTNNNLMKSLKVQAEDLVDSLATGMPNIEQFKVAVLGLFDTTGEFADTSSEITRIQKEMSDTFKATATEVSNLNSVMSDLNAGNALTADQVADLILQYPSLADNISKVADGWTIEKGAVEELRLARIQQQEDTITAEKNATTQTLKSTLARLKIYGVELEALDKRDNRMKAISDLNSKKLDTPPVGNPLMGGISLYMKSAVDDYNKEIDTAKNSVNELDQLYNQLDALGKLIDDPSYGVTAKKEKKPKAAPKNKDAPDQQDATQATINAINAESEARAKLNDAIKTRADELKDDGKYDESIAKRTTLLASQRKEVTLLSKANTDLKSKIKDLDNGSSYDLSKFVDANGELTNSFYNTYNALGSKKAQESLQALVDKYSTYTKAINSNSAAIDANKTAQKSTQQDIKDTQQEKNDKALSDTQDFLDKRSKMVDAYDKQIDDSKKRQSLYTENSAEFNAETKVQIKLLSDKEAFYTREISNVEARLKQGKLTNDQIKALNEYLAINKDALLDVAVAQADYAKQWESNIQDAAQEALDAIEEYYQKQNELAQTALDKELSAYEEFINERKKLLSRQDDTEDYNKQRSKLQGEELEIRKQIDVLSLDDSIEAKAKKIDLEKQLADKLEEIDNLQTDRTRQQRNDNLDDLQDTKDKEIKAEKDATDKKWQDAMAADANYSAIRQAKLEGNTAKLQATLQSFASNVSIYMEGIGNSIDMNITDKMAELQKFQDVVTGIGNAAQTNPSTPSSTPSPTEDPAYIQKKKDWQIYLENKRKAEDEFKDTGIWDKSLADANNALRSKYPDFKDGSYTALKQLNLFSAKEGAITPDWAGTDGKFLLAHQKEAILNKTDTSNLVKVVDWTRNIISNVVKIPDFTKIIPKANLAPIGAPIYNLNIHIESMTGDQKGADTVFKTISHGLKKIGK